MSPLLVVDVGNTSLSIGDFSKDGSATERELPAPFRRWQSGKEFFPSQLADWLPQRPCEWNVGSVSSTTFNCLSSWIREQRPHDQIRSIDHQDIGMPIEVEHPDKVGIDRLAACLAANQLRNAGQAAVVVDAGTAITIDVVSAEGVFQGGLILPGMQLSLNSLASGTDLLPVLDAPEKVVALIGKNTQNAMLAGVFWSSLEAVRGIIKNLQSVCGDDSLVVFTGGDTKRLLPHLDLPVHYDENLVLSGLFIAANESPRRP